MASEKFNFEKSLEQLKEIADVLENADTPLDDAINLFEKGIKLSKECSGYLENAKQKIISLSDAESEETDNG